MRTSLNYTEVLRTTSKLAAMSTNSFPAIAPDPSPLKSVPTPNTPEPSMTDQIELSESELLTLSCVPSQTNPTISESIPTGVCGTASRPCHTILGTWNHNHAPRHGKLLDLAQTRRHQCQRSTSWTLWQWRSSSPRHIQCRDDEQLDQEMHRWVSKQVR